MISTKWSEATSSQNSNSMSVSSRGVNAEAPLPRLRQSRFGSLCCQTLSLVFVLPPNGPSGGRGGGGVDDGQRLLPPKSAPHVSLLVSEHHY